MKRRDIQHDSHLNEAGKENDCDGGGDHFVATFDVPSVQKDNERVSDGAADAAVAHHELRHAVHLHNALPIGQPRQHDHPHEAEQQREQQRKEHETVWMSKSWKRRKGKRQKSTDFTVMKEKTMWGHTYIIHIII